MSTYYLSALTEPQAPSATRHPIPRLTLESMNGLNRIVLDGTSGWIRMPGSTGLEMPPYEIISGAIPGVPGSVRQDVRTQERPVFIPIYCGANSDHLSFLEMLDKIRSLIDPLTGTFKIVGKSTRGERELVVSYVSGLEGADGQDSAGLSWCKIGLNAVAHEPYARARTDTVLEFRIAEADQPFIGVVGGTDAPWPGSLSTSTVIGNGMEIRVNSEVPVYPTLKLTGPTDSFTGDLSPGVIDPDGIPMIIDGYTWLVDVPTGVPAGSTFRMVTDPRYRSIRLDGELAAGSVALGSALRPFYPGMNVLNVAAPGGTDATRIELSWREQYRSLW